MTIFNSFCCKVFKNNSRLKLLELTLISCHHLILSKFLLAVWNYGFQTWMEAGYRMKMHLRNSSTESLRLKLLQLSSCQNTTQSMRHRYRISVMSITNLIKFPSNTGALMKTHTPFDSFKTESLSFRNQSIDSHNKSNGLVST